MQNYGKLYRILMIAMLVMLTSGMAWAQQWSTTISTETTYYIRTYRDNNNNPVVANSTYGTYKFQYRESSSSTWSSAQNYITEFVVNCNNTSDRVKLIFQTTHPVGFMNINSNVANKSAFTVKNGILQMELGTGYESTVTLKRVGGFDCNQNTSAPFFLAEEAGDATKKQLIIKGNPPTLEEINNVVTAKGYAAMGYNPTQVWQDTCTFLNTKQFVIDGGYTFSNVSWDESGTLTVSGSGGQGKLSLFRLQTGTLELTNVTIQNARNSANNSGIHLMTNYGSGRNVALKMTHCWMDHLYAPNYPGLGIQVQIGRGNNSEGTVEINRCKFSNIFDADGADAAIRSVSSSTASLSVDSCVIWRNFGGGIRWQSLIAPAAQISNTIIKGNLNKGSGGGIFAKAGIALSNCKITNNTALSNGGGINYITYDEGSTQGTIVAGYVYPKSLNLAMDATTVIDGNKAINGYGGGICINGGFIYLGNNTGPICYEYDDEGNNPKTFMISMNQNGATISNNEAKKDGGGVYIYRNANAFFYGLQCNLTYGTIKNNTTITGNGGGVAINSPSTPTIDPRIPSGTASELEPQDVNVTISEANATKEMIIQDNSGSNGGGIYVEAYPMSYNDKTSTVNTTVRDYSLIDSNTATENGGGLYVQKGTVTITNNGVAGAHSPTFQNNTASTGSGGGVYLNDGNINMIGATIGGRDDSNPNNIITYGNTANVNGGGLYVNTGSVSMLSTSITSNIANTNNTNTTCNGGGIYVGTGDVFINRTEQGGNTPSQITYNQAHNGGGIYNDAGSILAFGTVGTGEAGHVQISNNQATAGNGGGIYCTGDATTTSYDIRLRRVDIKSNTATENGGGIYLDQGLISIVNGVIDGNTASGNGGGVYTHAGNIDVNPTGDERNATRITNNTAAGNGGGLNTHSGLITVKGKDANQRIIVSGNKAGHGSNAKGSGGGVFCMGLDGNTEYITMRHVDLINNRANGDGTEVSNVTTGCGGGMYLQQGRIGVTNVKIQNNLAQFNGGGINNHSGSIDVDGCIVGGSQYYNSSYSINASGEVSGTAGGNKADNSGGGIYTRLGDIDIEDYVETSGNITRIESKVTYNEAAKNGGGIDTREGIIYINRKEQDDQIEVAFNKANRGGGLYANAGTIIAYNALIRDNTATLHGGGANNHSGDIILYGGMLSNNTAKDGHGGGAYTNVGDIDLFQFPSTNLNPTLSHGTKVYNNNAKFNGGAFNNHTGRVDVRHATIYNNTATLGNGGAIFCEGPHSNSNRGLGYTIRLLCSDMVQNKTRGQDGTTTDPTGRGGGIYLKYGSIYAHYSNILNNEANINGGGIDNHSGDMLLYGCDVIGNRANGGGGGGIFTYQGDITIGPSTTRDGSNQSKASRVNSNSAHVDGGGINNQAGDISINGAQITNNTAHNGNGGGIFITGNIDMKAGRIGQNTASKGKSENGGKGGGVYSGGGLFNIHEREENPVPIVLIVDSEVKRDGEITYTDENNEEKTKGLQIATIHYHLVDQGKYSGIIANSVKHGILWGTNNPPTTEVVYRSTEYNEEYEYVQGEPACERIIIPTAYSVSSEGSLITGTGIETNKTYYAQAFFEYKPTGASQAIRGLSQVQEFVTFSDEQPIVISGSVSNITKNSAQGSGRVMDNGGSTITERGVQIWTGNTPPANNQGLVESSETTEFFTVDLTELTPNTPYHTRAYAKNENNQIAFGNTVDFKTLKDTPNMGNGLVTVSTSINENNVIVATASFTMPAGTTFGEHGVIKGYGFVWSRDDDPELSTDHTVRGEVVLDENGNPTTEFTATYTDVTPGITFYVRAYATTVENVVTPASDITNYSITAATQHVAPMVDGSPVVRAIGISGITQNSATITCQIYSGYQAGTTPTQYGVHLDNYTETNPANTYTSAFIPSNNATPNDPEHQIYYPYTYTVQLTNLKPGTTYYLKAYGTNVSNPTSDDDYNFGNDYNFTALPVMQPNVVITSVDHIEKTSATINCSVEDGGGSITAYGIKYSTDPNMPDNAPTIAGNNLSGNTFSVELDNTDHNLLTAHTTYYVQAYATNSAGTHTCQAVSFTTNYDHPSVAFTNNAISEVGFSILGENSYQYSAKGNYTVTPITNGEAVKTHGVCWSIFRNPTRRHSDVSDSHYAETTEEEGITSQTPKSKTFRPAYPNTKYYVHAYVSTSTPDTNDELADIVYDPADPNITFVSLPIVLTGGATAITNSSASLTVNINSPDREHHLRKYGVCWTDGTETPTKTAGHFVEGDITAANPTGVSYTLTANVGGTAGTTKTYRYRAYCINENSEAQGNIAYGDIKEFTTTKYTIIGTTNPTEAGRVSYEAGLTAGGGWDGTDQITVKAHAYDGWHFDNWTRDNGTSSHSSSNPLTETPPAGNHTYQANFKAIVSATVNPENTGTVSDAGYYAVGTTCTLTANAESGYVFLYWTDDAGNVIMDATGDTPVGNPYTFTVSGPVSLTANFGRTITVSANNAEYGSVSGGGNYLEGESVTVTATPAEGYVFVYWTDDAGNVIMDATGDTPVGDSYTFTVSGPVSLTANFGRTITVSANNADYGSVSGGGNYLVGESVTVTATPAEGCVFVNWTDANGNQVSTSANYTFNVTDAISLTANFNRRSTSMNTNTSGASSGSASPRPRDIYPAPAREPWDWDDEPITHRDNQPPTVETGVVSNVTATTATVCGIVTDQGDAAITAAGIWYSAIGPDYDATSNTGTTISATSPAVGTQFSATLENLNADAIYYVRAYATNAHGTSYGRLRTFSYNRLPSIDHNTALDGGGVYIAKGGKISFSSGNIQLNKATRNGGGIYLENGDQTIEDAIMHMKGICEVNGNHTPDFSLTEDANGNPVITGGGAGIYLDGKLYVGDKIDDAKGTHRLIVDKNYAMTAFTETAYTNGNYNNSYYLRNNVFLPYTTNKQADSYFNAYSDYTTPDNSKTRVIALLSDISNDGNTNYSHIGFSVTKGKIPVIATAKKEDQNLDNFRFKEYGIYDYDNNQHNTEEWMNTITGRMNSTDAANASIFDDARAYIAIHARQDDKPFRNDFIYLWDCWTTPIVKYDPAYFDMYGHELAQQDDSHYTIDAGTGLWHIKDEKGLAWFSANVNRLNGTKDDYPNDSYASLDAVLEADLDMTEYLWVPIGSVRQVDDDINTIFRDLDNTTDNDKLGYRGTFNGQGHVIKGIDCRYISSLVKYGLFGNLEEGANVYNTFVDASSFRTNDASNTYYVGGIAGLVEQGATISTSEARATIDVTLANKATSYVGGLVGKAEGTTEHPTVIHSSMAMPNIIGTVDYMGGLVGQLGVSGSAKCDLFNSFANPKFPNATTSPYYVMNENKYIGGLVGENNGTVENCYSRLQGNEPTSDGTNSVFGWFAGTNNANIKYCYAPRVADESSYNYATSFNYVGNPETSPTITDPDNYGTTLRYSGKYGFKHRDHQMKKGNTTYEKALPTGKASANDTLVGGLQFTLNRWVNAKNTTTNTYSTWTRTMASPINDDYPILEFADFNVVGSEDSIYMLYNADVNPMITAFNAVDATKHPTPSIYLYDVNPTTLNVSNDDNVMLAINEDVGILQDDETVLKARVGVTIKNTRKGANDYTDDPNWHLFSSAINEVPMGLHYHTSEEESYMNSIVNGGPHADGVWGNRDYFDPPKTEWYQSDDNNQTATYAPNKVGYFPTDTPYGTWRPTNGGQSAADADVGGFFDLFDYSEVYYHWMNYKREGTDAIQDHWHYDKDAADGKHYKIEGYRNDDKMLAGKGYLMALSGESMMMADGTLNTGGISHTVTKTAVGKNLPPHGHGSYAYDEPYRSLNIAGNPYQSYLDFHQFVFNTEANNSNLLFSENGTYSYATRSADGRTYQYFTTTQSENPETAGPYLHPHQGFFVKVKTGGELKFNNAMRATSAEDSHFRYEQINYPLVNLFCYDGNGKRDYTTVEISRPEAGGGHKMENLCMSDAQIYAHYNDDNYQILFAPEGVNVVPVRCKVIEDGYFTMRWNTYHGDFSYLHLIDNLTGADVDCLTTDEYKFEGKASDYNSRFKLVFDCTGIDEPETPEPDEGPTVFAFQMGDELIVNGEGMLQMFDLNGRCLMTRQAVGQQSSVSLPQVAAGMYLLRLTSNKQVRVQKMVIK